MDMINWLPYLSAFSLFLGLLLWVISRHRFFDSFSMTFKKLPREIKKQISVYSMIQLNKNQILKNYAKDLQFDLSKSGLYFRGKPVSAQLFVIISVILGVIFFFLSLTITGQYNLQTQKMDYNMPTNMIAFIIGLSVPQLLLYMTRIQKKWHYHKETPESFLVCTTTLRKNRNIRKAITEAQKKHQFPRHTQKLIKKAIDKYYAQDFMSFPQALDWVAIETDHILWREFAHLAYTDSTAGVKDVFNELSELTKRAESFLAKEKSSRAGLFKDLLKVSFFVLCVISEIILLHFHVNDIGYFLFLTSLGKLILSSVLLGFVLLAFAFARLAYQL